MNEERKAVGVTVEGLTKIFLSKSSAQEDFKAVDNVNLEVRPGEMVTLLGPSGCGKTTILRMLSGFAMPTTGTIRFGGRDVTNVPPNKRDVGMMFQSYALFPHLTVYENVAYGLRVKHVAKEELAGRMERVLELMQIREFSDRIPEQLSGGQQQRVALARAVVNEPNILLFDEPLSNLDAKMREYMRFELRRIQKDLGITSVYVTHDQAEAMAISDRIVIMKAGVIEQVGTPVEIYAKPNNKFVANFMGKANFVEASVEEAGADALTVSIAGKRVRIQKNEALSFQTGDTVCCMIRPEFLHLRPKAPEGCFRALVRSASYFGTHVEYGLDLGGAELDMTDYDLHRHGLFQPGETVPVALDEALVRPLRP